MGLKFAAALITSFLMVPAGDSPAQSSRAMIGQPLVKSIWGPLEYKGVSQFPIYRELGVKLFQMQLRWERTAKQRPKDPRNPNDPAYTWPRGVDRAIAEARRHGMRVLLLVQGSPAWANGRRAWNYAPRNPRDYANFLRAAARRYPSVRHWMVWGEPNINFLPMRRQRLNERINRAEAYSVRRYARLLDAAYGQLKRASPRNIVIGGNTAVTGYIRTENWIRHLRLPNGRPPRMDLFGHNAFSARRIDLCNRPGAEQIADFSDLGRVLRWLDRYLGRPRKRNVGLFLSEFGLPTDPARTFNFHFTQAEAARQLRRAFTVARGLPLVYGLGYYQLRDVPAPEPPPVMTLGLIDLEGRRKPMFDVYKRASTRRPRRPPRCAPRIPRRR